MPRAKELDALLDAFMKVARPFVSDTSALFSQARIPYAQAGLLLHLFEIGAPRRVSELAHGYGISSRAITPLIDGLEQRNLVQRSPDPHDRRAVLVGPTDEGRAFLTRVEESVHCRGEHTFGQLDRDEIHTLLQLMRKVADHTAQDSYKKEA
ncbi:MarR family winged helix-turn-helix transcriptional regulator [Streptomyces halobius]|uniref:MarR family winged helix-turn-helix transcriptional regulator n=1 Tax=Streptomyces halobius TaxID=2879846 RepID=A0ABY4MLX5_9ACTN|nr:MarR family winged helix-turn-helix transcriptional regulator [Streptomyces halobius]UQA97435.1 MarR family winged helix-turn-helix transcriptional regulator [Streptomyces halobius]